MEPYFYHTRANAGWVEVVCGSMFSGKTEELIRRLKRAKIAKQRVEIFKPALDTRYSDEAVVSHDENAIPSTPVHASAQIILLSSGADVVGIDEAQFFDDALVDVAQELARSGKRVIVAGLDQDYLGRPFNPMPQLMAIAEYVTKLHAVCMMCGAPANHSQRLVQQSSQVLLGSKEAYEPRCRKCFDPRLGQEPQAASSQHVKSIKPEADVSLEPPTPSLEALNDVPF